MLNLGQIFMTIGASRDGKLHHLPELKSFARGIQQDKAAVLAGLSLPWSQGPLEGHVNRLKLIKRSMYGRAKLPLLRARVLHVAEKEPTRATILAG